VGFSFEEVEHFYQHCFILVYLFTCMKKILVFWLIASQLIAACGSQPMPVATKKVTGSQGGFAVVELFTSQGCSSCPPADALLGREIKAYEKTGKELIALSFHVDYWNRLGWTDPYSQKVFSQRQYGYAARLKTDGVYTPQAIVNGQYAMVGSNQTQLESSIEKALAEEPAATLSITAVHTATDSLQVAYNYSGPTAGLLAAIVQRQASTPVNSGENGGRTLTNYQVVRSWQAAAVQNGSGLLHMKLPAGYGMDNYAVILYAQEQRYGKILAADMK
jgi:hypothetical protein